MNYTNEQKLIYKMITTNTGTHFLDSGGDNGRIWQRHAGKTIDDFKNEPAVSLEFDPDDGQTSEDLSYSISVFHFLPERLELDDVCDIYNRKKCPNWDGDYYGVSDKQQEWLDKRFKQVSDSWNSYNWDSSLSQVLQGTELESMDGVRYVLLQTHNGADVRGGYTDAKLFKVKENGSGVEGLLLIEDIYGTIDGQEVTNGYSGTSLTNEDGQNIPVKKDSKIELWLSEI